MSFSTEIEMYHLLFSTFGIKIVSLDSPMTVEFKTLMMFTTTISDSGYLLAFYFDSGLLLLVYAGQKRHLSYWWLIQKPMFLLCLSDFLLIVRLSFTITQHICDDLNLYVKWIASTIFMAMWTYIHLFLCYDPIVLLI